MITETAVGIHYDLSPCQTAVSHGTTNNKPACCVDKKLGLLCEHVRRNHLFYYLFYYCFPQCIVINIRIVLGSYYHGMYAYRFAVDVLDCHL